MGDPARVADRGSTFVSGMFRPLAAITAAVAMAAAAVPAGADTAPNALTPDGPATVSSVWRGAVTQEGLAPQLLTAVTVTVGPGGQGGPIRLRVSSPLDPAIGVELGPWTDLPATPGQYTLALPRPVFWDYRQGVIAIDQQVGGHAIVTATPCAGGLTDVCHDVSLDVFHDIADDDPARGTADAPAERYPGEQLALTQVTAPDLDRDHIPDGEDRTDLRLAATRRFNTTGQQVLRMVIHNAGPRQADQPLIGVGVLLSGGAPDAWFPSCRSFESFEFPGIRLPDGAVPGASCGMKPIPAGSTRIVTLVLPPASDRGSIEVSVRSEGADLAPADNSVNAGPAALVELERVSVRHSMLVKVRARRRGLLRVSFTINRHLFARTVRVVGPGPVTVAVPFHLRGRRPRAATIHVRLKAFDGATGRAQRRIHL